MVSTWTFRDFRGQIPLKACQANWQWVERLAATKISLGQGDSSVTQWPLMWKRTITSSREDAGQWFDLTIEASWRLTWRMLDEALDIRFPPEGPRGAYLACETTKDFRFDVRAAGKVVASGSIIRRGDSLTEKRTLKRISIRDQETRIPVNATAADSSTNLYVSNYLPSIKRASVSDASIARLGPRSGIPTSGTEPK